MPSRKYPNHSLVKRKVPLLILVIVFSYTVCASTGAQTDAVVEGLVTALTEVSAPLMGAEVIFKSVNGDIRAQTDDHGRYHTFLNPNNKYTMEVHATGFCPIHRPAFRPGDTGRMLSLNFTLVVCTNVDPTELDLSDEHEMYREETFGEKQGAVPPLVIGFGRRHSDATVVTYRPLNVKGTLLPVTISFDTMTITADIASHDVTNSIVRVGGRVSCSDGYNPPQQFSCLTITLGKNQQLQPCDAMEQR